MIRQTVITLTVITMMMSFLSSATHETGKRLHYYEKVVTHYDSMLVDVTWYTSSKRETDDTPYTTADGTRVRDGIIAVSRDMLQWFSFGDSVKIENHGMLEIRDIMHERWNKRVDIWCNDRRTAIENGKQKLWMYYNIRKEKVYIFFELAKVNLEKNLTNSK